MVKASQRTEKVIQYETNIRWGGFKTMYVCLYMQRVHNNVWRSLQHNGSYVTRGHSGIKGVVQDFLFV